jgi:hypothetical protein
LRTLKQYLSTGLAASVQVFSLLPILVSAWAVGTDAQGQDRSGIPDSIRQAALDDYHGPDRRGKDGPLAKAGLDLLLLYHQHQASASTDGMRAEPDAPTTAGGMQVRNGRVVVDAIAAESASALQEDLETLGLTDGATAGRLVSGQFPIAKIPDLARLESLRSVRPSRARTHATSGNTDAPSGETPSVSAPDRVSADSSSSRGALSDGASSDGATGASTSSPSSTASPPAASEPEDPPATDTPPPDASPERSERTGPTDAPGGTDPDTATNVRSSPAAVASGRQSSDDSPLIFLLGLGVVVVLLLEDR